MSRTWFINGSYASSALMKQSRGALGVSLLRMTIASTVQEFHLYRLGSPYSKLYFVIMNVQTSNLAPNLTKKTLVWSCICRFQSVDIPRLLEAITRCALHASYTLKSLTMNRVMFVRPFKRVDSTSPRCVTAKPLSKQRVSSSRWSI